MTLMVGAFSGAVACFALVGLSFFLIQPFLSQLNLLVTLPFFWVLVSSGSASVPLLGYGFKALSKSEKAVCSDGLHCGEEDQDSKLSSVSEPVDSTGATGRAQNDINRQSQEFSDEANNDAVRELVTGDVSFDFKEAFPPYFVLPAKTKLMKEDGTPIELDIPTICWPPTPVAPVKSASANEVKKEDVAVKQKERKRSYFLPCERQD